MATAEGSASADEDAGAVCDELDAFFSEFAQQFEAATGLEVDLDSPTLQNVAVSYIYDLKRYKSFHEIEIPDRARRAAYLCKWLTRLRPVRNLSEWKTGVGRFYLMANELFALYVVSGVLRCDLEGSLSTRMLNMLLYSARYRTSTEDTFILYFAHICNLS